MEHTGESCRGFRPSVLANWFLRKLGSYSPNREDRRQGHFLDESISKGWLPCPWERHPWVIKLARELEKIYIPKRKRKNLQLHFFYSKCSKKRESGWLWWIEIGLKFSQSEGNITSCLLTTLMSTMSSQHSDQADPLKM